MNFNFISALHFKDESGRQESKVKHKFALTLNLL